MIHEQPLDYSAHLQERLARDGVARNVDILLLELFLDQFGDLVDDYDDDLLALLDPAHAPDCLAVVSEDHALSDRRERARGRGLFNISARRVSLVVECETTCERHTTLSDLLRLIEVALGDEDAFARAVDEDGCVEPAMLIVLHDILGDLRVVETGDERAGVD